MREDAMRATFDFLAKSVIAGLAGVLDRTGAPFQVACMVPADGVLRMSTRCAIDWAASEVVPKLLGQERTAIVGDLTCPEDVARCAIAEWCGIKCRVVTMFDAVTDRSVLLVTLRVSPTDSDAPNPS